MSWIFQHGNTMDVLNIFMLLSSSEKTIIDKELRICEMLPHWKVLACKNEDIINIHWF
jgi:hypothetical protein